MAKSSERMDRKQAVMFFPLLQRGNWILVAVTGSEVGSGQDGHEEFSSGWSVYGSITIRSVIARQASFVVCCPECGKVLKQIIRIRRSLEKVLLASRRRVAPVE